MRRILQKGVRDERLHTIPLWDRVEEFSLVARDENPMIKQLGLEDKFVVMYSGNAGLAHRFEELLSAMQQLKQHARIFFLFVGSGPRRAQIESFAEAHQIRNYRYLDYFPRDQLRYSLALADVHLLTLKTEMVGVAVPSKLYGIMAAGKPGSYGWARGFRNRGGHCSGRGRRSSGSGSASRGYSRSTRKNPAFPRKKAGSVLAVGA